MPHYVPVPAHEIESFLAAKGFERTVQRNEVVYVRPHEKDPDVKIKVYTSIRVGAAHARNRGADSIKVCTVVERENGRSFGIGKFPRIHRTGSVDAILERMYQKMRSAYSRGTEWIHQQSENRKWIGFKNEFARQEQEQERQAFLDDPY